MFRSMQAFYQAFIRNPDGSWTCIEPATLPHPAGRVQVAEGSCFHPGTTFMGIDVVGWLEEQQARMRAA
jgi:hypothetical protein